MEYQNKIISIAKRFNFPGILDDPYFEQLNSRLSYLSENGFSALVENFLNINKCEDFDSFLFEIYVCRWLLSMNVMDLQYEPDISGAKPDFLFTIADYSFAIEVKFIHQVTNELVYQSICEQLDRVLGKTGLYVEIWMDPSVGAHDAQPIVSWAKDIIGNNAFRSGEKVCYQGRNEHPVVSLKVLGQSKKKGAIVVQSSHGTCDGLFGPVDVELIKKQVKDKISRANRQLRQLPSVNFKFLFLSFAFDTLVSKLSILDVLYGKEGLRITPGRDMRPVINRKGSIWERPVYRSIDSIFTFPSNVFLSDTFNPCIFPNPRQTKHFRDLPEPFASMTCYRR